MQFHRTTTATHSRSRSPRLHSYRTRYTRQRQQRMSKADTILFIIWCAFLLAFAVFANTPAGTFF